MSALGFLADSFSLSYFEKRDIYGAALGFLKRKWRIEIRAKDEGTAYILRTLTECLKPLNISSTHIHRIEKGESTVYENVIIKICETYSVDRDFFEGTIDLESG